MRFTKKKDYTGSIRKVWTDDKEVCYGIVGTVGDLLEAEVLEYCDAEKKIWCFLPAPGVIHKAWFGKTREEATENLN